MPNIIFSSYLTSSVASKIFLDTLDGDYALRGYKIDSNELTILSLPMNYEALVKKYKNKIKIKCEYCGKTHRTDKARDKCKKTHEESKAKERKIPSRSQFI